MSGSSPQYIFSGHETFPFRYPWLKKGYDAVCDDPAIFSRDDAITTLGVGKNMVRAIRHWCLTSGLLEPRTVGNALRGVPNAVPKRDGAPDPSSPKWDGSPDPSKRSRKITRNVDGTGVPSYEKTPTDAVLCPTPLGRLLLADDGLDPYLEDPATLWLLHWQIATHRQRAATWFYTFSHFHEPEFTRDLLTAALQNSAPC